MAAPPGFAVLNRDPQHGETVWVDNAGTFISGVCVHAPHGDKKVSVSSTPGFPQASHVALDITAGNIVFYRPVA